MMCKKMSYVFKELLINICGRSLRIPIFNKAVNMLFRYMVVQVRVD